MPLYSKRRRKMSTCDELYETAPRGFAERIATYAVDRANSLARSLTHAREIFIRERRLRATETALDGLPEDIRCDIGWPDLYERQISDNNQLKNARR
jgi:hypothetical protein